MLMTVYQAPALRDLPLIVRILGVVYDRRESGL